MGAGLKKNKRGPSPPGPSPGSATASLSNDPSKKGSNLFCCGAIRFPHIEMFSFLRKECINLQKGSLRKSCKQWPRNFHNFTRSARTISMLLRLRRDFVIRKLDRKKGIIYMLLCEDFVKFDF